MREYYESRGVSNSSLSLFNYDQGGSPTKFKKNHLDRDCDFIETPSLKNGKLIHSYVEDPNAFIISDVVAPSGKMKELVDEMFLCKNPFNDEVLDVMILTAREVVGYNKNLKDATVITNFEKQGKDYWNFLCQAENKVCLDKNEHEIVTGCIDSLESNKDANELLFNCVGSCHNEYEIHWTGKYGGYELKLKALVDRIVVTDDVIKLVDLKTTSKSVFKFKSSFEGYRYYRQLAFYKEAIKNSDLYKGQRFEFYIVAVQTTGLYQSVVYRIDEEYIKQGEEEYVSLLNDIGRCYKKNDWSSITTLDLIKE